MGRAVCEGFDAGGHVCTPVNVAPTQHPLSAISPTTLARAYREYLAAAAEGMESAIGEGVASIAEKKIEQTTGDLVSLSEALSAELGIRNAPKKLSSWLSEGDRDARHRELLECLLDRLDQELPILEKAFEAGKMPDLQMARQGRITKETLSPFVHHLSFSLETLQDTADLVRRGGKAVVNEVEQRLESVPDLLPPEDPAAGGLAGPGDFDDADDFDDPALGNSSLMALAKELLGGSLAEEEEPAPAAEAASPFVASLIGMIEKLISAGSLELTEKGTAARLGERLADAMDQLSRQHNPPEAIVNWFVDQEEVDEVFFDGDELRKSLSELAN